MDSLAYRLTFDPSFERSHQDEKDSIICSYSKNDSIARYRRVNLKIVIFEPSISPSSNKIEIFQGHILSLWPQIYQDQLKFKRKGKILHQKFRLNKAIYCTDLYSSSWMDSRLENLKYFTKTILFNLELNWKWF